MVNTQVTEIVKNNKTLFLFIVNLNSFEAPGYIANVVGEAFEKFSKYMKEDTQVIYIRDIPELCINGTYPNSHCSSSREAIISINKWGLGLNMQHLTLVVYKELFNMARLQNVGSEGTFGDAVFGEGAGLYFAKLMTTFVPPCTEVKVTKKMRRAALRRWNLKSFNYNKWFYKGRRGKWVATAIGYELAKSLYPQGSSCELRNAITAYPKWHKDSVRALNHSWLYS